MTDNNSIITRCSGEDTTVTDVVFDIADNGTFRERSERKDVSDHQIRLLSTEDELARVHTLGGDEELLLVLESEGVAEGDSGERRTTPWVMDDLGDYALEVPVPLAVVEAPEPCRTLAVVGVGLEDGTSSLTLCPDDSSHLSSLSLFSLSLSRSR